MRHQLIAQTVRRALAIIEASGDKPPAAVVTELDKLTRAAARVNTVDGGPSLGSAIVDALIAGTDPTTDPGVQEAATRQLIAQASVGLVSDIDRRSLQFLDTHAETLLEALRGPFAKAASSLEESYATLGDVDLKDTAAILATGGDAARAWADAHDAQTVISRIREVWQLLGQGTRVAQVPTQWRFLAIADVPPADCIDQQLRNTSPTPWDLLRRGWSLSMATPTTLAERVQAVIDEQQRRQGAAEDAFSDQYRRSHSAGRSLVPQ